MAVIKTKNEITEELSFENTKALNILDKSKVEILYDVKIKNDKSKLMVNGKPFNVRKAKNYLTSLLKPSECMCHIYDCSTEKVKALQNNIPRAEQISGCHINVGGDKSYFVIYGVDLDDIGLAASVLDGPLADDSRPESTSKPKEYNIGLNVLSNEEQMDFLSDDDEDYDPLLDIENNSSIEMSQLMEDVMLESRGSSPEVMRHDCTIDLRSDDEDDYVIITDSPPPSCSNNSAKKTPKNKNQKKNTTPAQAQQTKTTSSKKKKKKAAQHPIQSPTNNISNPEKVNIPATSQRTLFTEATVPHPAAKTNSSWVPFFETNSPVVPPFPSTSTTVSPQKKTIKTGLRKIVIDGSNIAMMHGLGKVFSCKGIELVINYFEKRGHKEIAVFVPQWRRSKKYGENPVRNPEVMEKFYGQNKLFFTPSREVDGKKISSYDDRFILKDASDEEGIVVSNDQYKDLYESEPEFRETIEKRILQVTFVGDKVMFPDDPLGWRGPSLDEFLSHSRNSNHVRHSSPPAASARSVSSNKIKHPRASSCKPRGNNLSVFRPPVHPVPPPPNMWLNNPMQNPNPMWGNQYRLNMRPHHTTIYLRNIMVQHANPQKVDFILNNYPDSIDINFLVSLL